jgi:hypothetical protein
MSHTSPPPEALRPVALASLPVDTQTGVPGLERPPPPMPKPTRAGRLLERARRCQLRMMRANLKVRMAEFHKAQRAIARVQRQRQPCKEARAVRSLMHELGHVLAMGRGTGVPIDLGHRSHSPPRLAGGEQAGKPGQGPAVGGT